MILSSERLCGGLLLCLVLWTMAINAQAQQNTLFDTRFAHPPQVTTAEYVVFPLSFAGQQMSAEQVAQTWCDDLDTPTDDATTQYNIGPCELVEVNSQTRVRRCVTITHYWPNGTVRSVTESCPSAQVTIEEREQLTCPPTGFVDFALTKEVDNTQWCFSMDDILDRDSCPDSINDGSFVLPVNQVGASSFVCDARIDGSSCAYRLDPSGDFYQADFEGNGLCYTDETIDAYQGDTNLTGSETGCIDIGAQTLACAEDESNVCNAQGQCQSGCGYVNDVFVCLSGDLDGDNIGDYADPDIDGDGIANGLDLDNDGDGIDDPVYDNGSNNGGSSSIVNIDLTETNNLLSDISNNASSLVTGQGQIKDTVDGLGDKIEQLSDIEFSELPGGRDCQYLCDVFGPEEVEEIKAQAQSLRDQISQRTEEIRAEIAGVVDVNVSGTLSDIVGTIKGQQYGFKWAEHDEFWQMVGNIILVITTILVLVILMGGNRE